MSQSIPVAIGIVRLKFLLSYSKFTMAINFLSFSNPPRVVLIQSFPKCAPPGRGGFLKAGSLSRKEGKPF